MVQIDSASALSALLYRYKSIRTFRAAHQAPAYTRAWFARSLDIIFGPHWKGHTAIHSV